MITTDIILIGFMVSIMLYITMGDMACIVIEHIKTKRMSKRVNEMEEEAME